MSLTMNPNTPWGTKRSTHVAATEIDRILGDIDDAIDFNWLDRFALSGHFPNRIGTCRDCGVTFNNIDGAIMRSHRRRVHGDFIPVPGSCDA